MTRWDIEAHPLEEETLVDLHKKIWHGDEDRYARLQEDMKNALQRLVADVKTLNSEENQEEMIADFAKAAAEQMYQYARRVISETMTRPRVIRTPSSDKKPEIAG